MCILPFSRLHDWRATKIAERGAADPALGVVAGAVCGVILLGTTTRAMADSPFATGVVSYVAGVGAQSGFTNPNTALGAPERFTGEGLIPGCVTPFQPAFRPNEIVSLGVGGTLTLAFDHPVEDDPRNPFGIDLLVFGNAFFTDASAGFGVVAGLAAEGGSIAVSADGIVWTNVPNVFAEGLFPTLGYLDAGPYATVPGVIESDFLRPVDPAFTMADVVGLDHGQLIEIYDGSGGGAGIDLAVVGLPSIRFVRISGPLTSGFSPEVDAIADVAPLAPTADFDGDGNVGASDLAALLAVWGTNSLREDLDGDGIVGAGDLSMLLALWGSSAGDSTGDGAGDGAGDSTDGSMNGGKRA